MNTLLTSRPKPPVLMQNIEYTKQDIHNIACHICNRLHHADPELISVAEKYKSLRYHRVSTRVGFPPHTGWLGGQPETALMMPGFLLHNN